jgi:hypothetical protein
VIFPISVALFRETRHAAKSGAATHTQLRPAWAHRRGSVKKPASDRQLGIARRQVARRSRQRRRDGVGNSGSFPASKGSYAAACWVSMLDTQGPCDMLENWQKDPKFREVVGLPVRPSRAPRRRLEALEASTSRSITDRSRAGSPLMDLRETIRWSFRDVAGVPLDRCRGEDLASCASRAPRLHALEPFHVRAQRSIRRETPLREGAACALQRKPSSRRSTWRWGLVSEETA